MNYLPRITPLPKVMVVEGFIEYTFWSNKHIPVPIVIPKPCLVLLLACKHVFYVTLYNRWGSFGKLTAYENVHVSISIACMLCSVPLSPTSAQSTVKFSFWPPYQ